MPFYYIAFDGILYVFQFPAEACILLWYMSWKVQEYPFPCEMLFAVIYLIVVLPIRPVYQQIGKSPCLFSCLFVFRVVDICIQRPVYLAIFLVKVVYLIVSNFDFLLYSCYLFFLRLFFWFFKRSRSRYWIFRWLYIFPVYFCFTKCLILFRVLFFFVLILLGLFPLSLAAVSNTQFS